jgi:hypothetical protein
MLRHCLITKKKNLSLSVNQQEETVEEDWSECYIHPMVHEKILDRLSPQGDSRYMSPNLAIVSSMSLVVEESDISNSALPRYLLPRVIHQVEIGEELDVVNEPLALLLQVLSRFLCYDGMAK